MGVCNVDFLIFPVSPLVTDIVSLCVPGACAGRTLQDRVSKFVDRVRTLGMVFVLVLIIWDYMTMYRAMFESHRGVGYIKVPVALLHQQG